MKLREIKESQIRNKQQIIKLQNEGKNNPDTLIELNKLYPGLVRGDNLLTKEEFEEEEKRKADIKQRKLQKQIIFLLEIEKNFNKEQNLKSRQQIYPQRPKTVNLFPVSFEFLNFNR